MASDKSVRVGDRVRIDGGRWDGNSGVVERIVQEDEPILNTTLNESYALVRFPAPLEMVDGKLDSVGVPTRRLKPL